MNKNNTNSVLQQLFANNRQWADSMIARDPDFFSKLLSQQSPEFLWIGCSDSRVPANTIVGLEPGELFVHRNVANVVVHSDLNSLSVVQFAIDVLRVKHIIVCGHYGCSGVKTALERRRVGLADNWLRHVQDVHNKHTAFLPIDMTPQDLSDRLCELNVIEQVVNVDHHHLFILYCCGIYVFVSLLAATPLFPHVSLFRRKACLSVHHRDFPLFDVVMGCRCVHAIYYSHHRVSPDLSAMASPTLVVDPSDTTCRE